MTYILLSKAKKDAKILLIKRKVFCEENMKTTIKDIAKSTGLSTATISKYLNNKPISQANQELIQNAIQKLHYEPNLAAQSLRSGKTNLIGLIISDIGNYFWGPLIANLTQIFSQSGYTVIVRSYYRNADQKKKLTQEMCTQNFSGIILLADNAKDTSYQPFIRANIPIVVIDQIPNAMESTPVDCVLSDGYSGGREIARHLIESGHQHVYVNAPIDDSYNIGQRILGITDSYSHAGLPLPMIEKSHRYTTPEAIKKYGEQTLPVAIHKHPEISAVIFTSYELALGGLAAINTHGYRIPQDFSVISFDDDALFKCVYPSITAVSQDMDLFSLQISKILIRRMNGDYSDFPHTEYIPVTLHKRQAVQDLTKKTMEK